MSRPFIPPSDYSDDESDRESQRIANAQRGRLWRSSPERVGGDNWGLFAKSPGGPALPPGGKGPQRGRPFAGETPGGLGRPRGGLNQSEPYSPIPSDYEESRSHMMTVTSRTAVHRTSDRDAQSDTIGEKTLGSRADRRPNEADATIPTITADPMNSPNGRGYPPREREAPRSRERAPGPDDSYDGFRPPDHRNRRTSGQPRRYDPEDRWDERENGRYPPKDGAMPTRDYNPGQRRFTPKEQVPPNRRFTPQDQRNVRKNTPHDPRVPSDFEPDRIDRRRPGEPPGGRSQYDRDDVSWGPRFPTDGPYGRDEAPPSGGRSAPPVDRRGHDMPPSERRGQPMHSPPNPQGVVATGHRPDFPPTYYISPPRVPEGPHRPLAKNGPYPERENGYISDASSRYRPRDDSYQSDDENSRSSQNDGYEIPAKKPNRGFSYAPKESLERSFNQGSGLPFNPPTPRPGLRAPTSLETVSDEDRGHPEGQPSFAEEYRQKPTAYPQKSEDPTGDDVVFLSTTLAYWLIGVGVASLVVGTVGLFFCMTWQAMAGAPLWSGLYVIATGVLAIVNNKYPSKILVVAFVVVAVVALILQLVNVGVTGTAVANVLLIFVLARAVWRLRQRQEKKGERNISMMNLPQAEHVEHPNPTHNQRW
ncbi:Fatty acid-binding protein, heart [Branchiostoma belcheri]|nr:Fatty acid-binding protein, heart [Branchiostoma belcheri]